MKFSKIFVVLFVQLIVGKCGFAQSTFVASPNVGGGNTGSTAPFDLGDSIFQSMRYQQVYASSDFLTRMPHGGYINGIRFDVASAQYGGRPFGATLSNIQINLSTTSKVIDGLSTVFTENLGLNDIVVLGPTSVTLSDSVPGGADIIIQFSRSFFYDPSMGNLLMDVRNFAGGRTSPFNANNVLGDTISSVFSFGSVNDAGGRLTTGGLITIFDVTPVPEPSAVALGVAALVALGLCRFGKRFILKHLMSLLDPDEKSFCYRIASDPGVDSSNSDFAAGYFGRIWQSRISIYEDNVVELSGRFADESPIAALLSQFDGTTSRTNPYTYLQMLARGNVVRAVDPRYGLVHSSLSSAVVFNSCEKALVDGNLIDLDSQAPISFAKSGAVYSSYNQASSGVPIRGLNSETALLSDDITTLIEDVQTLSLL